MWPACERCVVIGEMNAQRVELFNNAWIWSSKARELPLELLIVPVQKIAEEYTVGLSAGN